VLRQEVAGGNPQCSRWSPSYDSKSDSIMDRQVDAVMTWQLHALTRVCLPAWPGAAGGDPRLVKP